MQSSHRENEIRPSNEASENPHPPLQTASNRQMLEFIRFGLLIFAPSAVLAPGLYQPLLDQIWRILRSTNFYNWSSFETWWTVFCYAAIEVPITVTFMRAKPRGMRRPARRGLEAIIYVAPLLLIDFAMIKKFADVTLEDMLISATTSLRPRTCAQIQKHTKRALPVKAPSLRRLILELIASFIIYDALFFCFHLLLHTVRPLKKYHAPHHAHDAQLNPQVTNQLHITERLGLILLANFSLNIIRSHVLTRTVFVPLFVWLLVEIHSGMDLPWAYNKILLRGWGGGAFKHLQHHRGVHNAGLEPFFNWCDALWEMLVSARKSRDSKGRN